MGTATALRLSFSEEVASVFHRQRRVGPHGWRLPLLLSVLWLSVFLVEVVVFRHHTVIQSWCISLSLLSRYLVLASQPSALAEGAIAFRRLQTPGVCPLSPYYLDSPITDCLYISSLAPALRGPCRSHAVSRGLFEGARVCRCGLKLPCRRTVAS